MSTMVTPCGTRRVKPVVLDGKPLLRVEAKGKDGWNHLLDTASIAEVSAHVDIATLEPAV